MKNLNLIASIVCVVAIGSTAAAKSDSKAAPKRKTASADSVCHSVKKGLITLETDETKDTEATLGTRKIIFKFTHLHEGGDITTAVVTYFADDGSYLMRYPAQRSLRAGNEPDEVRETKEFAVAFDAKAGKTYSSELKCN